MKDIKVSYSFRAWKGFTNILVNLWAVLIMALIFLGGGVVWFIILSMAMAPFWVPIYLLLHWSH